MLETKKDIFVYSVRKEFLLEGRLGAEDFSAADHEREKVNIEGMKVLQRITLGGSSGEESRLSQDIAAGREDHNYDQELKFT